MTRPAPSPIPVDRDARVDWLRGLAALLILVHHLFAPFDWSATPPLDRIADVAAWCMLGVPVFFVLSGRCIGEAWLRGGSAARFALRRVRRIYPPYLASLLVCLGVVVVRRLFVGVNDVAALPATAPALLATVTLATAPATAVPTINWVYWSLTYEVVFYALLACLLPLPSPRARLVAWLTLHAALCGLDLAGFAQPASPDFFLDNWSLFALGAGLALLPGHRAWAFASLGIGALHLVALLVLGRAGLFHLVGLATAALLLLPGSVWSPRADGLLPRIGVVSYSLYLIHVPIGVHLLLRPAAALLGPGLAGSCAALALAAFGSIVASLVFHRIAERPWMRPALAPNP
ncbi:MAG: acyltransferase [Burkholderiales bacterium]|nr:acyltransferase [Opitutaceae bacterium]